MTSALFSSIRLADLELTNRIVVSPMAQYRAVDGTPTDWHLVHYAERAKGGAGLVTKIVAGLLAWAILGIAYWLPW